MVTDDNYADLYDEAWQLATLLRPGEAVINMNLITEKQADLENLIVRAKYYDECKEALPHFENIVEQLKLIQMGARP